MLLNMPQTFYHWLVLEYWLIKICQRGFLYPLTKAGSSSLSESGALYRPPCRACWGTQCSLQFLCSREEPGHVPGQTLPSGSTGQVGAASEHWLFVLGFCSEVQVLLPLFQQRCWPTPLKKKLFGIMHSLLKCITSC